MKLLIYIGILILATICGIFSGIGLVVMSSYHFVEWQAIGIIITFILLYIKVLSTLYKQYMKLINIKLLLREKRGLK